MARWYCICNATYNIEVEAEDQEEAVISAEELVESDIPDHVECECEKDE